MRWDTSSGRYDMGFRNYAPGLNQFLSRDMYDGALGDMQLSTDPFTGNRYTFAAGNPVSNIELDGHTFPGGTQCGTPGGTPCNPSPPPSGGSDGGGGCGSWGLSCAFHFGSDALSGFTGTLGGIGKGLISQVRGNLGIIGGCATGSGNDCWNLINPLGPMSPAGAIRQAAGGLIGAGKTIYSDFTTGHPGRAIGTIGAFAAIFALTRGAGAGADTAAAEDTGAAVTRLPQDVAVNPKRT